MFILMKAVIILPIRALDHDVLELHGHRETSVDPVAKSVGSGVGRGCQVVGSTLCRIEPDRVGVV